MRYFFSGSGRDGRPAARFLGFDSASEFGILFQAFSSENTPRIV